MQTSISQQHFSEYKTHTTREPANLQHFSEYKTHTTREPANLLIYYFMTLGVQKITSQSVS